MTKLFKGAKYFLLAGLMAFALVSCDKNKIDDSITEAELVGTWTVSSSESDFTVNGVPIIDFIAEAFGLTKEQAEAMAAQYSGEGMTISGTIEFKSDGTYLATDEDGSYEGTWVIESGGKELVVDKGTEDEWTFNISEGTSSKLVGKVTETFTYDMDNDGSVDTLESIINLTLTK